MFDDCFNGKRVFLIASKSDTSFNVGENPSRTTRTSRNTVRVQRAKRVRSQAVISARTSGEKVSSISLYSDISPVRQCWNIWFSPISALTTLTEDSSAKVADRAAELVSAAETVADRKFEPEPEPRSETESAAGTDSE